MKTKYVAAFAVLSMIVATGLFSACVECPKNSIASQNKAKKSGFVAESCKGGLFSKPKYNCLTIFNNTDKPVHVKLETLHWGGIFSGKAEIQGTVIWELKANECNQVTICETCIHRIEASFDDETVNTNNISWVQTWNEICDDQKIVITKHSTDPRYPHISVEPADTLDAKSRQRSIKFKK